jgi:predicted nucleic acid-binding protein
MCSYLDTNFIIALLLPDAHTSKAENWFERNETELFISNFSTVEFASVVSRLVRTGELATTAALNCLVTFDKWIKTGIALEQIGQSDLAAAADLVRDFQTKLSAPDAIHLAAAGRIGAALITFDERLATAAALKGVSATIPAESIGCRSQPF